MTRLTLSTFGVCLFAVALFGCDSSDDDGGSGNVESTNNQSNAANNADADASPDNNANAQAPQCARPCGARQRCYFGESCLDIPAAGGCWDERDCGEGLVCMGATYCPPDVVCIVGTMQGNCEQGG